MDLSAYIDEVGIANAARQFGVKYRTAASWRARERFPRRKKALEIESVTKKRVTVSEIYRTQ